MAMSMWCEAGESQATVRALADADSAGRIRVVTHLAPLPFGIRIRTEGEIDNDH